MPTTFLCFFVAQTSLLSCSGLVLALGYLVEDMMITVCWTASNLEGFIKTLKYIELGASNMLAITNLAICVNLALIVSVSSRQERVGPQRLSTMYATNVCFFVTETMFPVPSTIVFQKGEKPWARRTRHSTSTIASQGGRHALSCLHAILHVSYSRRSNLARFVAMRHVHRFFDFDLGEPLVLWSVRSHARDFQESELKHVCFCQPCRMCCLDYYRLRCFR